MFNKILDLEYFPSVWAIGNVVPVFKKGDKNNANNYRGITIISCLGKLFTKIMNNRINKFVEEKIFCQMFSMDLERIEVPLIVYSLLKV